MRPRDAGQQHQDGGEGGEQDALQDAQQQHGHERDRRGIEIQPADPRTCGPSPGNPAARHGGQHHGGEHRLRQVLQQPGQEEQAQRERQRREDERERGARARLVVHRRLRQAAGDRIALPQRRREVRRAEAEQLLARIERVAVLCREGAPAETLSI